ncbi:DUF1566 domain-containing protein [Roseateles sp.]|uniref:Lcl domain-containing protein n=1 Tax=Roseateles sp. TaxID=1971397 RepID=UPI00326754FA
MFIAFTLAGVMLAAYGLLTKVNRFTARYVEVDSPTGFVYDRITRLVWHRCPLGTSLESDAAGPLCRGDAAWVNVKLALAEEKHFSSFGQPWRLPTRAELESLSMAPKGCCHALDPIAFPVFEEPPERLVARDAMDRYAFHAIDRDEARRVSWRVDSATGQPLEEPLRQEAFIRMVRNASPEEIAALSFAWPLSHSDLARVDTRLKPQPHPRSAQFIEGRKAALLSGEIVTHSCNASQVDEWQRGCRDGVQSNLNARIRQGIEWAQAHKPNRSYDCKLEDPIANFGCWNHFRKHLGDVFPNLPEATTTAECQREARAAHDAGLNYEIALGTLWRAADLDVDLQACSLYDRTHAQRLKVKDRPGLVGGPSPY